MTIINQMHVQRLIQIESQIHYGELPPPGMQPFVSIQRNSPIILSAPHGARTFRNNNTEIWHEEDEYTAGMALLLSEICQTSVIATTWRTEESDPNEHGENRSGYKRALRQMVECGNPRPKWFIDLHGASQISPRMAENQKVDLGTGRNSAYMDAAIKEILVKKLDERLSKGAADRAGEKGWDAEGEHRMASFAKTLGLSSVQIEMKPGVRVASRRVDASMYQKNTAQGGPYAAQPEQVIAMLQILVDFIANLKDIPG